MGFVLLFVDLTRNLCHQYTSHQNVNNYKMTVNLSSYNISVVISVYIANINRDFVIVRE